MYICICICICICIYIHVCVCFHDRLMPDRSMFKRRRSCPLYAQTVKYSSNRCDVSNRGYIYICICIYIYPHTLSLSLDGVFSSEFCVFESFC